MANVDENINRFINAKERAKRLIQMDADGSLDRIKQQSISENKMSYNVDGTVNSNLTYNKENTIQQQTVMQNDFKINKSKLPNEILESFKNKQIDTTLLNGGMGKTNGSVLDQLDALTNGKVLNESNVNQIKKQIKEESIIAKPIQNTSQGIDYSMIKMIVEECVRKYTSSVNKKIINEINSRQDLGTLQAMKIGNKFSFITSNGDLYEAKLKFIKNINDK